MSDDFYVGYLPKAPATLGKWTIRIVIGLVLGAVATGVVLIFNQSQFAQSKFEYGVYREYTGILEEWPYPMLRTSATVFLLVGPGKHGFAEEAKGLKGKSVRLRGALIERGKEQMLEVAPSTLAAINDQAVTQPGAPVSLGRVKLKGEIVDSKCYLGVMNPGEGKVHRDCAARCISGGAPPAFVARDASGEAQVLLLAGSDGRKLNHEVLPFVAEPIEISGDLVRSGSNLILKSEPADFHRLE